MILVHPFRHDVEIRRTCLGLRFEEPALWNVNMNKEIWNKKHIPTKNLSHGEVLQRKMTRSNFEMVDVKHTCLWKQGFANGFEISKSHKKGCERKKRYPCRSQAQHVCDLKLFDNSASTLFCLIMDL